MLKQTAVYWAPKESGFDEFGRPEYESPVEIDCRWVDKAEEFIDAQGTRQVSKSKIYVGEDVKRGGMLMLGELTDLESLSGNPKEIEDAFEVRSFSKTPNFKGTLFLRVVML